MAVMRDVTASVVRLVGLDGEVDYVCNRCASIMVRFSDKSVCSTCDMVPEACSCPEHPFGEPIPFLSHVRREGET